MMKILLNIDKLNALPIVSSPKGPCVKASIFKLVKPRGVVTHYVVRPKLDNEDNSKLEIIGTGIKGIVKLERNSDLNFFMLFAEGGSTPVYKHSSYDEAVRQALFLEKKLGKRVYVLKPVSITNPVVITEDVVALSCDIINEIAVQDDIVLPIKRKRIQKKVN